MKRWRKVPLMRHWVCFYWNLFLRKWFTFYRDWLIRLPVIKNRCMSFCIIIRSKEIIVISPQWAARRRSDSLTCNWFGVHKISRTFYFLLFVTLFYFNFGGWYKSVNVRIDIGLACMCLCMCSATHEVLTRPKLTRNWFIWCLCNSVYSCYAHSFHKTIRPFLNI